MYVLKTLTHCCKIYLDDLVRSCDWVGREGGTEVDHQVSTCKKIQNV